VDKFTVLRNKTDDISLYDIFLTFTFFSFAGSGVTHVSKVAYWLIGEQIRGILGEQKPEGTRGNRASGQSALESYTPSANSQRSRVSEAQ
jgi:hypothetical protein